MHRGVFPSLLIIQSWVNCNFGPFGLPNFLFSSPFILMAKLGPFGLQNFLFWCLYPKGLVDYQKLTLTYANVFVIVLVSN